MTSDTQDGSKQPTKPRSNEEKLAAYNKQKQAQALSDEPQNGSVADEDVDKETWRQRYASAAGMLQNTVAKLAEVQHEKKELETKLNRRDSQVRDNELQIAYLQGQLVAKQQEIDSAYYERNPTMLVDRKQQRQSYQNWTSASRDSKVGDSNV